MYHVSLTHFSVLLYSFCASVWILYITLSSNSLILSFTISSLIFIYRVLNFTLSYVRISLVKLSVSSIFLNVFTFPNVYVWWLQHLDHLSVKYCGNNLRVFLRSYWGEFSFFFFVGWSQIINRSPYSTHGMRCFRNGFSSLQRLANRYMCL